VSTRRISFDREAVKIACAFDHAGVPLREAVLSGLSDGGHQALDLGDADDYPQSARAVTAAIIDGEAERGVLVCGSGAGVAVAASKVRGIRAATVSDGYTAHQSVEHDDLNVLCLGARVIGPELARELVRIFAAARFSGAERHVRRLAEVAEIENDNVVAPGIAGSARATAKEIEA
jgi:ribose 5-phosphate isomerase B